MTETCPGKMPCFTCHCLFHWGGLLHYFLEDEAEQQPRVPNLRPMSDRCPKEDTELGGFCFWRPLLSGVLGVLGVLRVLPF